MAAIWEVRISGVLRLEAGKPVERCLINEVGRGHFVEPLWQHYVMWTCERSVNLLSPSNSESGSTLSIYVYTDNSRVIPGLARILLSGFTFVCLRRSERWSSPGDSWKLGLRETNQEDMYCIPSSKINSFSSKSCLFLELNWVPLGDYWSLWHCSQCIISPLTLLIFQSPFSIFYLTLIQKIKHSWFNKYKI